MIQRRILSAALSAWVWRVVSFAVRFFLAPFVVHRLGDTQYGLLALVGSVIGQSGLLNLGIGSAVTKYVAEYRAKGDNERIRNLVATALSLYSVIGLVVLVLSGALAVTFSDLFNIPATERDTAMIIVLLMGIQCAISIPCSTSDAVLRGLQEYAVASGISIFGALASAAITVGILLMGGGAIAMVAANIPLGLGLQILAVQYIRRVAPELRFSWRGAQRKLVKSVLSFSTSMFVLDVSYSVQMKIDEIVIAAFLPVSLVSPYSLARKLSGVPQSLAEQFLAAFLPVSSQLHAEGDAKRTRTLYLVGTRITLAICVPLGLVLICLAGPLLTIWIGEAYASYSWIVVILTTVSLLEFSHWPGSVILQGQSRHHRLAVVYVIASIVNLGLSLALVRPLGLIGVALGTLIPTTVLSLLCVWPYIVSTLGVRISDLWKESLFPTVAPAVPMLLLLYGGQRAIAPTGIVGVGFLGVGALAIYAVVFLLFGAGDQERQLIKSVMAKLMGMRPARSTE